MDNKAKLLEYLREHDLMALGTMNDRPAVATVYFGIDDDFTIYIVTPPSSEHGKNIMNNHLVACAIADTNQRMYETKQKVGVQIKGQAIEVIDAQEMKKALHVWSKNRDDVVAKYLENIMNNSWISRPFKITPVEIKWFKEELFGSEGVETFKF